MKKIPFLSLALFLFIACKSNRSVLPKASESNEFKVAFGSCNKHDKINPLWDDVLAVKPDVWIWGGDIVYADTEDMELLGGMYNAQNMVPGYKELRENIPVIGTWDDHDYGLNDGGVEFHAKKESQQVFLNFMGVDKDSQRRNQEGVYASHEYQKAGGKVKIIVLDTRYFRTSLTPDTLTKNRNKPNTYGEGTILGNTQWEWLTAELKNSSADFNLIMSSVQFLSNKHGFECWGNFPHEVDKLNRTIATSNAKGVIILSGDRHISEFSKTKVEGLPYPLIDFTSSGLTHVYSDYSGEENPYRKGKVVFEKSFGLIKIDLNSKMVVFTIRGDNGVILGELQQSY